MSGQHRALIMVREHLRAVRIYLDFGFRPLVLTAEHARGWAELAGFHPALAAYAQ